MQGSKLYVSNIPYSVTSEQLTELFSSHALFVGPVIPVGVTEPDVFGL